MSELGLQGLVDEAGRVTDSLVLAMLPQPLELAHRSAASQLQDHPTAPLGSPWLDPPQVRTDRRRDDTVPPGGAEQPLGQPGFDERANRPHTVNPRWGTWPETGQQWAEPTWASAKTLNKADVYFFDDDQGIDLPASWKLQYWNGSAYVDVPGASGYPLARNQYNSVTFTTIDTTRLRVLLTSNGTNSVGLLEAEVYGP
ncbi:hypothetical protein [Streptomyces sp. V4I8]|uniref:hypothetical protein n=1 Tax=Streptomyces sp. V4I8 TaxID=3156469 RepID=UPI0035123351